MVLVALTNAEIGERVAWLWKTAGWRTARDLAREMGEKDLGIFTKLHKGESLTPQRMIAIAQLCVGRGNVADDIGGVLGFLHGTKEDRDVWVPNLSLVVGGGEAAPVDSDDSEKRTMYSSSLRLVS